MSSSPNNSSGTVVLRPGVRFNSIKVFSATMMNEREHLGARITNWFADNPDLLVTEIVVTQSSDEAFHCLTFTIFYFDDHAQ